MKYLLNHVSHVGQKRSTCLSTLNHCVSIHTLSIMDISGEKIPHNDKGHLLYCQQQQQKSEDQGSKITYYFRSNKWDETFSCEDFDTPIRPSSCKYGH